MAVGVTPTSRTVSDVLYKTLIARDGSRYQHFFDALVPVVVASSKKQIFYFYF